MFQALLWMFIKLFQSFEFFTRTSICNEALDEVAAWLDVDVDVLLYLFAEP